VQYFLLSCPVNTRRKWLNSTRPCRNGSLWLTYNCGVCACVRACVCVPWCIAMLCRGSPYWLKALVLLTPSLQLTKAKELLRVLLSSSATEEGLPDSKGGSPSQSHSQPLQRKQRHSTASTVTGRAPLPDGTSCSESSESTIASDAESDGSSPHAAATKVHPTKQRATSIVANSNWNQCDALTHSDSHLCCVVLYVRTYVLLHGMAWGAYVNWTAMLASGSWHHILLWYCCNPPPATSHVCTCICKLITIYWNVAFIIGIMHIACALVLDWWWLQIVEIVLLFNIYSI